MEDSTSLKPPDDADNDQLVFTDMYATKRLNLAVLLLLSKQDAASLHLLSKPSPTAGAIFVGLSPTLG